MKRAILIRFLIVVGSAAALLTVSGDSDAFRFYHQHLRWRACEDDGLVKAGAECADVRVPLDYDRPGGRTMIVAISRIKAVDPAQRRGILMSNPGGPGAEGLDSEYLLGDVITPQVRARYDLIGMDPRGVGRSGRAGLCGWPVPEMIRSAGMDEAGFRREVTVARRMADTCLAGDVTKLRQLTTRNTARDMDLIRSVLGERKVSYYGLSYGTYLGAVFAQMFPERSDRIVLDSAIDPDRYWEGLVQNWGPADELALDDWANWVATQDDRYHLGESGPQVRALVEDLLRHAGQNPIVVDGGVLDDHLFPFVLHNSLRSFRLNDALAEAVRAISDAAAATPAPQSTSLLRELLQALQSGENSAEADIACGDAEAPRDPEWYWRNIERTRTAQPVFGALANNIQPCAFWPQPVEPPTLVRNAVPALIVQATGDPRTPYPGAVHLHHNMTGSRLVTLRDARKHGTFTPGLSNCVNTTINGYLAEGQLPNADVTCYLDQPIG
ncbi:alpha/beta hydrolase [Nocardia australiensis]|uniref:alpha/beta hydrolase n=1 Tax=Nocardia australiensis TaxID=2887191 RepID=UPI001D14B4D4|nr:alpha/beta hydrolase [Nocardia australiensis]